jgi:hypothetical protein
MFEKERLSKANETEILSSESRQKVKIGDVLVHRETDNVCSIFSQANALSQFTSGKSRTSGN